MIALRAFPAVRTMRRAALLSLLLAGGCATAPLPQEAPPSIARAAVEHFTLQGRLSASAGERHASGRVEWVHRADHDHWTLFSPLGQIVAQLEGGPDGAALRTADGQQRHAASTAALLPEVLGIDAPVAQLPYWVQASPDPQAEIRGRDTLGRPALVIDRGWRIEYPEYAAAEAQAMPRRIDISRGDAQLRLLIDDWAPLQ